MYYLMHYFLLILEEKLFNTKIAVKVDSGLDFHKWKMGQIFWGRGIIWYHIVSNYSIIFSVK